MRSLWLPLVLMFLSIPVVIADAARDPQYCFEDVTSLCGVASGDPAQVFSGILLPLESQLVGFSMVIFWGGIMAIIWFKTENIMLLGIIGIFVNATIIGLSSEAQGIGLLLLGVANGLLLFQMLRQRISIFS